MQPASENKIGGTMHRLRLNKTIPSSLIPSDMFPKTYPPPVSRIHRLSPYLSSRSVAAQTVKSANFGGGFLRVPALRAPLDVRKAPVLAEGRIEIILKPLSTEANSRQRCNASPYEPFRYILYFSIATNILRCRSYS